MAVSNDSLIRFVSYNCRGWNSGKSLLNNSLLDNCDICLIQEHWLLRDQLCNLNCFSDFTSFAVSGMDSCKLLCGHPYGGCGFLIRNSICPLIKLFY